MQKHPKKVASLATAFLVICGPAFPQSANTPAAPAIEEAESKEEAEKIVELSPFVVSAEDNQGWVANNTLVGSRLRSKLDDVASQMEVFTMDFMDEFGLNSIDDAAIYSLNVENSDEFVSSVDSKDSGEGNLRVRGIGQARRSREFFATETRSDNYNLERVTIASGPNPMMFGIGAPTGAVDSTLARPIMNRNSGKLRLQVDSFGGMRGEFRFNHTLVKDKLAVLGAVLADNKKSDIRPSLNEERRVYGAVLYTPFKNTRFSAHYEHVDNFDRMPPRIAPLDKVRVWYTSGDLGSVVPNQALFDNDLAWQATRSNPDSSVYSLSGDGAISVIGGNNPYGVGAAGGYTTVGVQNIADNGLWPGVIDPVNSGTTRGISLINDDYYPRDTSYTYYTDFRDGKSELFNVFFNQQILKDLNFEAAYQSESGRGNDGQYMLGGNGGINLNVDPNRYLSDGVTPNPYAGMLYFDGLVGYSQDWYKSDEWRTALSYEFDFKDHFENKWVRLLGQHRFAGVLSGLKTKSMSQEYRYDIQPVVENGKMRDPVFSGVNYWVEPDTGRMGLGALGSGYTASASNRSVNFRSYVSQDLGWEPRVDGFEIGKPWEITDNNGEVWTVDPMNAATGTNGEKLITGRNTNGTQSKFDSKLFSYQGFLLGDRVVLTYGRRQDSTSSALAVAPAVSWTNPETGEIVEAQSAGYQAYYDQYSFDSYDPANEATGTTELKGIVVHPFRNWGWKLPLGADLSIMYTKSNTFAPNTTRRNPDGSFIESERGEGHDQGVRLSLFENKFDVRYNEYEVVSSPSILSGSFQAIRSAMRPAFKDITRALTANEAEFRAKFPDWPLANQGDPQYALPFGSLNNGGWATMNFFNYLDPYNATADTAAKGKEISLQWRPLPNLDVRLTWNDQSVVQTGIASQWIQFAKEFEIMMDNTTFTEGYVPGDTEAKYQNPDGFDMDGDGVIRQYTWEAIPNGSGSGSNVPQNIGSTNTPWGHNDDLVPGGWKQNTMKEQWINNVWNGKAGIPVLEAYNGRQNEFTRDNRMNINAMYRFTEGTLRGLRVGAGYRWRAPAAIGFGVKEINGVSVPDVDIIQKGKAENSIDFSFGYSGKTQWLGDRKYSVDLNIRNAFPGDKYVARNQDFFTGDSLTTMRMPPTQFVLSLAIDL